ncbi:MAG: hypothetical protein L6262_00660 [Weeksellaceae bacterium]|nr:hypothetical protein [Weeksellaceae bacterium]
MWSRYTSEAGFLTGAFKSTADLEPNDFRKNHPRYSDEAMKENIKFVDRPSG